MEKTQSADSGRMKLRDKHSERSTDYVRENCNTERGSNQGAIEGIGTRKRGREVKRLLPEPRDETGSKSFMRFQFYGFGNKSYRFMAKRPGNTTEQEIFWRGVYVGRSVW